MDISQDSDRYLSTKEAAQLMGLSPGWLERARLEGNGPVFSKINNTVRYKRSIVLSFMEQHQSRSTSEYESHQKPPLPQARRATA
ncbi:MAG TPA: helix-turn-helix domain-containing protein [Oculatellaceae cyanobacterium]